MARLWWLRKFNSDETKHQIHHTASVIGSMRVGYCLDRQPSRLGRDTGITAGMIVLTAAIFGYLKPERPWIWALTVSGWIPLYAIVRTGDFKMLLVTLFGFAGAYLGSSIKNNKPVSNQEK